MSILCDHQIVSLVRRNLVSPYDQELLNPASRGRTESIPRSSSSCPFGTYAAGNYCSWSPRR